MTTPRQGYLMPEAHLLPLPFTPAPEAPATADPSAAEPAQRDAERLRERGYREGLEAGRAQGETESRQALDSVAALLEELARERRRLLHDLDGDIVRLALDIAAQVVRSEVAANPQVVLRMVAHGLERMGRRERILIRVHPKDAQMVESALSTHGSLPEEYEVVEDSSVEAGGCVLESPTGSLDIRPSVQLDEVRRELLSEHGISAGEAA